MSRFAQRLLIVVALLSCVALVGAQGGGGGQGRRGGQFGMRGGFGAGELQLAMRSDVQKELNVTDDQKAKLQDLQEKQRQNRGNFQPNQDPAERQKMMEERRAQEHKDVAGVLNETQMKRLGELVLQREGNSALGQPDIQKALNFTSDQTQKVKDLQQKQQEANQQLGEKMRNQELTREEGMAAFQKNTETLNTELAKILTPDQAAKFKTMQGKPFTFENTGGGRGFGGGGGRRGGGSGAGGGTGGGGGGF